MDYRPRLAVAAEMPYHPSRHRYTLKALAQSRARRTARPAGHRFWKHCVSSL